MHRRYFIQTLLLGGSAVALDTMSVLGTPGAMAFAVSKTDAEWKEQLSPQAYQVLRHQGTERPFSSPLNDEHRKGTFLCDGCDLALFSSATKF